MLLTLLKFQTVFDNVDAYLDQFVSRLYSLNQYGIPEAGFGFVYDRKSAIYAAVYKKVLAHKERWTKKFNDFDHLTTVQLPLVGTDEERIEILQNSRTNHLNQLYGSHRTYR